MSITHTLPLRYFQHRLAPFGLAAFLALIVVLPLSVNDPFWLSIIGTAGIYALAAISLNVVTGYLGEASLGQAFFLAVGCYTGLAAGVKYAQLPLLGWMVVVLVVGAIVGLLVAPLAMRLSGPHLIVITLGFVFLGIHVFSNWRSLSGGPGGSLYQLPLSVGSLDFGSLTIGARSYYPAQGLGLLIWMCVAVALWWVYNLSNSRRGREMRAIRDNPLAAQVAGVSMWRNKTAAFAVCGAIAALAGAFYGQHISYVEPSVFDLHLSIEIVAILIIGGSAATFGPVIGGIFVALVPALLDRYLEAAPFVLGPTDDGLGMTVPQLSALIYALLLVLFLLFEPRGINALIARGFHRLASANPRSRAGSVPASPTPRSRAATIPADSAIQPAPTKESQ